MKFVLHQRSERLLTPLRFIRHITAEFEQAFTHILVV